QVDRPGDRAAVRETGRVVVQHHGAGELAAVGQRLRPAFDRVVGADRAGVDERGPRALQADRGERAASRPDADGPAVDEGSAERAGLHAAREVGAGDLDGPAVVERAAVRGADADRVGDPVYLDGAGVGEDERAVEAGDAVGGVAAHLDEAGVADVGAP